MKTLALCAGYGGLEMGLAEVSPVELVAYAEYDDAPARIMAHHHEGTPNLRDVTKIDWHALLALGIVVMTAGYPCQPFSHAGKREGENDPRHLWPHIAKGIGILRPALCVFENVRGHLSLGFDQVLLDLDALGYDVRYYLLRAADIGACHGRARLFIFATAREQQGPVVPPTGAPVALIENGAWVDPEAHLFGREPFEGKLPPCGWLHQGGALYAAPKWAERTVEGDLFGTPTARMWKGSGPVGSKSHAWLLEHGNVEAQVLSLLPTPRTSDTNGAGSHGQGGPDLRTVVGQLLPTTTSADAKASGGSSPSDVTITDAVVRTDLGRQDNPRHGATKPQRVGRDRSTSDPLLPTPSAADGMGGHLTRSGDRSNELLLPGAAKAMRETWGEYAPAIARWEVVLGRPAPAPTEEGPKGGHRLSPRFVEWMQGLPDGWVTDTPDLTRNHQLKALGNGVVPAQAAAAYRAFLTDTRKAEAA